MGEIAKDRQQSESLSEAMRPVFHVTDETDTCRALRDGDEMQFWFEPGKITHRCAKYALVTTPS